MRFLLQDKANEVSARVRQMLSDPNVNHFRLSALNMRILSGEEEGAFAWIALNYLRGYFNGSASKPYMEANICVYISQNLAYF